MNTSNSVSVRGMLLALAICLLGIFLKQSYIAEYDHEGENKVVKQTPQEAASSKTLLLATPKN